jgi:hypothetical protein
MFIHDFDLLVEVKSPHADPLDVPIVELLEAMQLRLDRLKANHEEAEQAFGHAGTYDA